MISQKKEKEFITYCCYDYDVALYRHDKNVFGAETKTQHVKHKIQFSSNDTTWKYVTILLAFNSYIKIICSTLRFVRCFVSVSFSTRLFASRVSSHEHQNLYLLFLLNRHNRKSLTLVTFLSTRRWLLPCFVKSLLWY